VIRLNDFEILNLPELYITGRKIRVDGFANRNANEISPFLCACVSDNAIRRLRREYGQESFATLVGWLGDWRIHDGSFTYIAGIVSSVPPFSFEPGMHTVKLESGALAVGAFEGESGRLCYYEAHAQILAECKVAGYTNRTARWSMEIYNDHDVEIAPRSAFRYCLPIIKTHAADSSLYFSQGISFAV
jgi:hypothetical protein